MNRVKRVIKRKINYLASLVIGHNMSNNRVMIKAVSDADVVSFDMFDTLIFRKTKYPIDVFSRIDADEGFQGKRIEAEVMARREKKEPSIDEIYQYLLEEYGDEEIERLKEAEIQEEYNVCFANQDAKDFYRKVLQMGKTIVITTDMYMDSDTLKGILTKCGYYGYSHIFVSCESGVSKREGELFNIVSNAIGYKKVVHIGDNVVSDYIKPICYGMSAVLYKNHL